MNGGAPVRLTPPEIDAGSPTLSRAGNRLAFVNVFNDVNIWQTAADGHGTPQMLIRMRPDVIALALRKVRGKTIVVHSPNEFAKAIQQVERGARQVPAGAGK